MAKKKYDFSGWATRCNYKCSDGKTILKDAFKDNDRREVPLVWGHIHNDPSMVLGKALLVNKPEGVRAYCSFNDGEKARDAKRLVEHGDVVGMSIWANGVKMQRNNVLHGDIKEVSIVLAGANPGAYIDYAEPIMHSADDVEYTVEDAIVYSYTGEPDDLIVHSDSEADDDDQLYLDNPEDEDGIEHSEDGESDNSSDSTPKEVFDSMTDEQKALVYYLVDQAKNAPDDEDAEDEPEDTEDEPETNDDTDEESEEEETMKHNVFENQETDVNGAEVEISEDLMHDIFEEARRGNSLKDTVISHGITNLEYLFPEDHDVNRTPEFISRDQGWVSKFMSGVHHTPFSRIRTMQADITEDEARAKGYTKGNLKKDEVFKLLKRSTSPTTIYKKQSMDRDDVIDITDFDVVSWLKTEMRTMLNEEIARAALVGDGRTSMDEDKISEEHIRPIWTDAELYTIHQYLTVAAEATPAEKALDFIVQSIRARKLYKGSGNPTLYANEDVIIDCLLLEDKLGRKLYNTTAELAKAMHVKEIVSVPVMENLSREDAKRENHKVDLLGIIVNLNDYSIGADKGGAVSMFDDFDIDYNKQKYLIETRCSGALIKPYSAITIEFDTVSPTVGA